MEKQIAKKRRYLHLISFVAFIFISSALVNKQCFSEDLRQVDLPVLKITVSQKEGFGNFIGYGEINGNLWAKAFEVFPNISLCVPPPPGRQLLANWEWSSSTLKETTTHSSAKGEEILCVLCNGRYISQQIINQSKSSNSQQAYRFLLRNSAGAILKSWISEDASWKVFPSENGKYVAVVAASKESITRDRSKLKDITRSIGLLNVIETELKWTLHSHPETLDDQLIFSGITNQIRMLPTNDGKRIVIMPFKDTDTSNQMVVMIDTSTCKILWSRSSSELLPGYGMRFSTDNMKLFVGNHGPRVVILNVNNGGIMGEWPVTKDGEYATGLGLPDVSFISVSPDGEYVAAVVRNEVYVRYLINKQTTRVLHFDKQVHTVSFSPNSSAMASMISGSIYIWPREEWASSFENHQ